MSLTDGTCAHRSRPLRLACSSLEDIRQAVREAGLTNVSVLQAGERATNLPAGGCEAIFMRRVYHHLSAPSAILASIHEALNPGGRLVVVEFKANGLVGRVTRTGVNRAALMDRSPPPNSKW